MDCFCSRSKWIYSVRIILLDETEIFHEIQADALGQHLLDLVFAKLNLNQEKSYFGLRYLDQNGQTHWLCTDTKISRQIHLKEPGKILDFWFGIKFYAVDPCKLIEETTRYQFYLQLKQDVLQGRLPVLNFELSSILGAYILQAEYGDFEHNLDPSEFHLANNQNKELEMRIIEIHKKLRGMSPTKAELNYLDRVKWLDFYGVDLHNVLGENQQYFLGLTPSGIIVLRDKTIVTQFFWPRISKVYSKGRYFMLRVCDKNNEINTYGFETPNKLACKHLLKCCEEHREFFRLRPTESLENRFRQSTKEDCLLVRTPPTKRQRRPTDDNSSRRKNDQEKKQISIPQPSSQTFETIRSTSSIPTILNGRMYDQMDTMDQMSTRSAPWAKSQQRGLFGINSSPKSVRSASSKKECSGYRNRSSSVESYSSNESRSRRRPSKHKRLSDNESELSRGSGRSSRSQNSHRKHRRNRSKYRSKAPEYENTTNQLYDDRNFIITELIDSEKQWYEVQRQQAERTNISSIQQASIIKSNSIDTFNIAKKHKKHRLPIEGRNKIWTTELAKHLNFELVDTAGMSESQLKAIPYTVIESNSNRRRPPNKPRSCTGPVTVKDRVDRIRSLNHLENVMDGSSTNSSTRELGRNHDILHMLSNLQINSNLSRIDSGISERSTDTTKKSNSPKCQNINNNIPIQNYLMQNQYLSKNVGYHTNY